MRAAVLKRMAAALARLDAAVQGANRGQLLDGDGANGGPVEGRTGNVPASPPELRPAPALLVPVAVPGAVPGVVPGAVPGAVPGPGSASGAVSGASGNPAEDMLRLLEGTVARVEARLGEAEVTRHRLLAALAHVPEGVIIADQSGAIVYRNPQAAGFSGARYGEALAERALGELLATALTGRSDEQNLELFSPPRRTLAIRARPLLDSGRPSGAVAIIEDVSEKRRLEAVRRDFVANISHELKTPVGALSLVAETLEDEDDPAVVARLTRRMRAEAERLGRIIEDLLDLSRIEADESPSRDPLTVHLLLAEAVDRLRPVAEHRGIRLEIGEPNRNLVIQGDRRQLVSAVHNLVDNAIKYSEDKSSVEVRVQLTAGPDGEWIEITVADHGIGIPSRDLERVFERFYRVDRARSRDTGGTGLGLSIVRHVAGNHGGEVLVESREGEGSTFQLRLPSAGPGGAVVPATAIETDRRMTTD